MSASEFSNLRTVCISVRKMLSEETGKWLVRLGISSFTKFSAEDVLPGWRLVRHLCRRAGGFGECNRSLVRQDAIREFIRGGQPARHCVAKCLDVACDEIPPL